MNPFPVRGCAFHGCGPSGLGRLPGGEQPRRTRGAQAFAGLLFVSAFVTSACVATGILHAQDSLATHREIIRGTVVSDSARGLAGVEIVVSMAPDRSFQRSHTDDQGRYEIVFEHGTGDYLVHASAEGMQTVRKRVTRRGKDSLLVVNIILQREGAQQLSAVNVRSRRPTPSRNPDTGAAPGTGAMERAADGVSAAISPDEAGSLRAIAATVPGVLLTPSGISVGGAAPEQNSTTLNGMSFPGADIPRDAGTYVRVRTSVYDPSEGWFGGAQQAVELGSGIPLATRQGHFTADAPFLQYTDPYSDQLGHRFTNVQGSLGGTGFADREQLEYNYGVQADRRTAGTISLVSAPATVLRQAGVAPDSATRLLSALEAIGVPTGRLGPHVSSSGSFIGSIGSRPFDFTAFRPTRTVWQLVAYATASREGNFATSPTSTPGYSAARSSDVVSLQAHLSSYIHDVYLASAQSAISRSNARTTPSLDLPAGVLLLTSDPGDDFAGVSGVHFGGNSALARDLVRWTWETSGDLKLYPPDAAAHRIKIAGDSRIDTWRAADASDASGTFAFNSIADLAQNQPISFSRALNPQTQSAAVWNGFLSIGDFWKESDRFQLLYGARLEADHFLTALQYNPAIASAFGQRTDFTPNRFHVSPRLGFTYTIRGEAGGVTTSPLGQFNNAPTGYIRGGIGEFRAILSPAIAATASAQTGLPSATQSLDCVGAATPIPVWTAYASNPAAIPTGCIGAGAGRGFVDAAPSVGLFDRSYTAPRSWRANLAYGSVVKGIVYSVEGLYSLNLDQSGRTDLNFANQIQFTTPTEGRPIYVRPGSIVPASGALVSTGSRRDQSFGSVVDNVSNLRSVSRQATFSLSPDLDGVKRWFGSLSYTLADTRAIASGFDNSTFGSPAERTWARGDFDVRHRILLQGGISGEHIAFTLFGRFQSGFPFTPLVGSDVNGDGLVNDRAFIFDAGRPEDSSLAAGMRSLLHSAQANVRRCLMGQLGRAAAANSCEGPWTASLNAQLDVRFMFPRTHRSTRIAFAFDNPLGGLDQLLHGVDHLHGWGTSALPDPVLYNVRGFEPATNQFRYAVNPRFGDTRPSVGIGRLPFRVSLDLSFDLGAPIDIQFVEMQLKPGRRGYPGTRLDARTIKRRYDMVTPDPFSAILEQSDSLMLSIEQVESLQQTELKYKAERDSILVRLADYLSNVGDDFVARDAARRQNDALGAVWDLGRTYVKRALPAALNRYQLRMLPWPADRLYTARLGVHGLALASR